jgi:amino acid adenylation domain-containing protein
VIKQSAAVERSPYERLEGRGLASANVFIKFKREEVEQSIQQRFEQQVAKYPERIAVKTKHCSLTYKALNQAANRIARVILARGGEEEKPVALLLSNDAPMIAALLGVLKAGKICVALDPSLPEARASYILEDSQAKLIVTDSKHLTLAGKFAQRSRPLMNIDEVDANVSIENLGISLLPDAFACILYTSGSTGQPKGVIQNHRNILHNAMRYAYGCRICPEDRVTLLASVGTGQGMPTVFSALLSGATLCPFNIREEGVAGLGTWLNKEEITVYISAPTLFRHFAGTLVGGMQFPKLRMIRLGAEQVRKSDVELYKKHFSAHCILGIFLSATETGNLSQYFVDKETQISGHIVPVGYAVKDMEVILRDDNDHVVGTNQAGEITVKSRYLSPGYWRNPSATRATFIADPAGGDEKIYRTGDLGRMRSDGCLEHLGRKDFQVKIRGYKVEVAEIETALLEHVAIEEAVVVAQDDLRNEKRLIAYVVPSRKGAVKTSELRAFLEQKLPGYMAPSAFMLLDSLPLLPNGKLDRHALPPPDRAKSDSETAFVAPRTTLETKLAEIWSEILEVERVGIHNNFFDLGGHSLLAAQMLSRVRDFFHVDLSVATLLAGPTVADLTVEIVKEQAERASGEALHGNLAELEQMSDKDAKIMLDEETGASVEDKLNSGKEQKNSAK